jgi:hypothetical protein
MSDSYNVIAPVTLVRQYLGRLLDISSVGCLIEMAAPLTPGTVGRLEATIDGKVHVEVVRVARIDAAPSPGGSTHIGLEFLLVTPADHGSIRAAILRLTDRPDALLKFIH